MNQDTIKRLRRIEGQVRGISGMIAEDRYCIDILHQITAVKAALRKVESQILKDHAATCVEDALSEKDTKAGREKFAELVELFQRQSR